MASSSELVRFGMLLAATLTMAKLNQSIAYGQTPLTHFANKTCSAYAAFQDAAGIGTSQSGTTFANAESVDPFHVAYANSTVNFTSSSGGLAFSSDYQLTLASTTDCRYPSASASASATIYLDQHSVATLSMSGGRTLPFASGNSPIAASFGSGNAANGYPDGYSWNWTNGTSLSATCYCSSVQWSVISVGLVRRGVYGFSASTAGTFSTPGCGAGGGASPQVTGLGQASSSITFEPCLRITSQPQSTPMCPGGVATVSVDASSPEFIRERHYRWEWRSCHSPDTWTPLRETGSANQLDICLADLGGHPCTVSATGQGTSTLSLSAISCFNLAGAGQVEVRCAVWNECDGTYSDIATVSLCAADFDCSGSVGVADVFGFLGAWFAGAPSADLDGGGAGISDIFRFLNLWFAGC